MRNNETHPIVNLRNGFSINVMRSKTAKAIVSRCYEADKSAAIAPDGLAVHGNAIDVIATKCTTSGYCREYTVVITSTVFEQSTLISLVDEVFAALNAHKAIK